MRKNLILLTTLCSMGLTFLLHNPSEAKKPPKNNWGKVVSTECKTNTTSCTSSITEAMSLEETQQCIACCSIDEKKKCFNYCICECSIAANPTGSNTYKLCSKRKK